MNHTDQHICESKYLYGPGTNVAHGLKGPLNVPRFRRLSSFHKFTLLCDFWSVVGWAWGARGLLDNGVEMSSRVPLEVRHPGGAQRGLHGTVLSWARAPCFFILEPTCGRKTQTCFTIFSSNTTFVHAVAVRSRSGSGCAVLQDRVHPSWTTFVRSSPLTPALFAPILPVITGRITGSWRLQGCFGLSCKIDKHFFFIVPLVGTLYILVLGYHLHKTAMCVNPVDLLPAIFCFHFWIMFALL